MNIVSAAARDETEFRTSRRYHPFESISNKRRNEVYYRRIIGLVFCYISISLQYLNTRFAICEDNSITNPYILSSSCEYNEYQNVIAFGDIEWN